MKRPFYVVRANRKDATNSVVEGVSETGEISPSGLVQHIEDWEGRVKVNAAPATIRYEYSISKKQLRKLTLQELIERGYFYVGHGPAGIRLKGKV